MTYTKTHQEIIFRKICSVKTESKLHYSVSIAAVVSRMVWIFCVLWSQICGKKASIHCKSNNNNTNNFKRYRPMHGCSVFSGAYIIDKWSAPYIFEATILLELCCAVWMVTISVFLVFLLSLLFWFNGFPFPFIVASIIIIVVAVVVVITRLYFISMGSPNASRREL